MNRVKYLSVFYHGEKVGKMALHKERFAAFEYDKQWIANGFSRSPFSLPLEQKVFLPKMDPFDGIFGQKTSACRKEKRSGLRPIFRNV